ncbi:hypothetical protein [Helicobacter typhlonius]|uniref:hypothetical protein n=1 Tax=Helicobacter typhlonius TaxID=76936 RepID=UPI002FE0C193
MKCAVAFLIRFLTLCNTSCMLKGSLAHMASSSIGCVPSEITIKKNRYGFVNDSYVAQCRGGGLITARQANVWGGNTANTKCAQSMP